MEDSRVVQMVENLETLRHERAVPSSVGAQSGAALECTRARIAVAVFAVSVSLRTVGSMGDNERKRYRVWDNVAT